MSRIWITLAAVVVVICGTTCAVPYQKEYYEISAASQEESEEEGEFKVKGLYWKPYVDKGVPRDALLAGHRLISGEEVATYIGQAPIDVSGAQVQTAAIYSNSDSVTSTYTFTVSTKKDIKILCSNASNVDSIITWIPAEQASKFVPDEDFVITGHELSKVTYEDSNMYVGRGRYDDTFLVGKVVMGTQSLRFYPFYAGREIYIKKDYEILAYARALSKLKEQ